MLEHRDPEVYGGIGLSELETRIYQWALELQSTVRCRQTNHEGEFIDWCHEAYDWADGVIVNPGAWAHYSWAIHDALELFTVPVVEVHLSNIDEREEWRRFSVLEDVVAARFIGKGPDGYREAIEYLVGGQAVSRIARLAALLEEPLLVAGPPYVLGGQANVRYLTGLQSSNAAVLVEPDGGATLYTDFRYANRARALEGFEVVETARGLIPAIGELLAGRRILFDEQNLPHALLSRARRRRRRRACRRRATWRRSARSRTRRRSRSCAARARSPTRSSRRSRRSASRAAARRSSRGGSSGASARPGRRASRSRRSSAAGATAASPHAVPGDVADRAGRARHDRRRLHPRRLLLGLHAHVRGRRGLRAAAGAPRALPRRPARRARRGRTRASTGATPTPPRARASRRQASAGPTVTGWDTASGSRSTRRRRCVPSRRTSSRPGTSSPSSPGSTCRTRERRPDRGSRRRDRRRLRAADAVHEGAARRVAR